MSDISSVTGLSNLSRDLYYQSMINNNPASNMLRAISGDSDENSSGASGLMNAVSGLTSSLNGISDPGSIGDLSGLDSLAGLSGGSDDLLGASAGLSSFSSILESYLNAQRSEAAAMAESLSAVLEEAAQTEDTSSLTYRTVQEIYEYFQGKNASADQGTAAVTDQLQSSQPENGLQPGGQAASVFDLEKMSEMDFSSLEKEQLQAAEAAFLA